jgi:Predicted methyltransferases
LAEDTRASGKLLKHYEITTPMQSYHMHNEHHKSDGLVQQLLAGTRMAIITDAGSPGISDPGFLLTKKAIAAGVAVEALPGATAFVPALTVAGLPCDKFVFEGFLPVKKGRQKRFTFLQEEKRTMVFYESPHKLAKTLRDMATFFGEDRLMSVSREITKLYEEHVRGTIQEVSQHFEQHPPKGEFVLILAGKE